MREKRDGEGKKRRKKIHFSRIYTFNCGKASLKEDHSQIGGPGFSRAVYCNDPDCYEATVRNYSRNYVRTTKYTPATFLPKSLFEQFRRIANFFFLLTGILSFTPIAPYSAISAIAPLIIVIIATMIKEGIEDWRRMSQDGEVNSRKVKVHLGEGNFNYTEWKRLKVGDIVKVEKDQFFPADLLLLSSSYEDSVCYVETMNLDGETNLKLKQALESTSSLDEDIRFRDFQAFVRCEDPNANLYTFVGSMELEEQQHPLNPQQLLLRDSKLRNTDYVYGVVVFTGHDTKVMQNSTDPPSKRSKVEKKVDKIIYLMFAVVFTLCLVEAICFGVATKNDLKNGKMKRWYLRPDDSTIYFDPKRALLAAILQFFTAVLLYTYFIPISLYVSIEIVKVLQSLFIGQDLNMYYEEGDKPTRIRTSNLNEELGQVDTILSDKTGTLTCNSMEFIKCSVGGTAYGYGVTEVERAMARRRGTPLARVGAPSGGLGVAAEPQVKGFNFKDERIMNGNWVNEDQSDVIEKFFRLLSVCHTAIPEVDDDTGKVSYEAESPDEAAFVIAAREVGFEFCRRTQTSISVEEMDHSSGERIERVYELLTVLEFNSTRKRMSVIVRDGDGKLLILCKGADSVMFGRLRKNATGYEEKTKAHVNLYADAGLRTLILAYRELSMEEYREFSHEFSTAKNSVGVDRETLMDQIADKVETGLILLGATAVEDKLQNGVPECIDKLAQAGIKLWVLTGDKMETAINIGFACSLLRQGMKQIIITLESPEVNGLDEREKAAINKSAKESVVRQLTEAMTQIADPDATSEAFALIIDGNSLVYALNNSVKDLFLKLSVRCASVICCRSSPKQKALVTRLVKRGTGKTTLAIGDGANDVGMLQEADIGVGISGVEGMQAVMSSDIAVAQFRFLEQLLLVHGHWCYRRISSMICYFFYKNIAFGTTIFLLETYSTFSAQSIYNDWFLSLYNVFFTSLPAIALGVFDQDVSSRYCLKFPLLYQEGVQDVLFRWRRVVGWMGNGASTAAVVFFFIVKTAEGGGGGIGGRAGGAEAMGATVYTCVVWAVNLQMAASVSFLTWVHQVFIWGSVALWYVFLLLYGSLPPQLSATAYQVFAEAMAPSPSFWLLTLLSVVSALLPYFVFAAVEMRFFPMYHQMIQWMRLDGGLDDPEFCHIVRQRSIRPTTVGFTARVASSSVTATRVHVVVPPSSSSS